MKRKHFSDEKHSNNKKKRSTSPLSLYSSPVGFIWDENNYSCAYDSLFSILLKVFKDCPDQWNELVSNQNDFLHKFTNIFTKVQIGQCSMEDARDIIHAKLHIADPAAFSITEKMAQTSTACVLLCFSFYLLILSSNFIVTTAMQSTMQKMLLLIYETAVYQSGESHLSSWVLQKTENYQNGWKPFFVKKKKTQLTCQTCHGRLVRKYVFANIPNFLAFITNQKQIQLNPAVYIGKQGTKFRLCGIIYFGGFHFTARIVDINDQIWYNDGIVTGNSSTLEDPLKNGTPYSSQQSTW